MPGTNDFKAFAGGGGANVITQVAYEALTALIANGFTAGTAESNQLNKVWRQATIMAAVLGEIIAGVSGENAVDDGTTATLAANLMVSMMKAGFAADTGAVNAYVVTLDPAPLALHEGMLVGFSTANVNTGAVTLNVNGLGAVSVVNPDGTALSAGQIPANTIIYAAYNSTGTRFEVQSLAAAGAAYARLAVAQSFTKAQRGAIVTLADGATITPDFSLANNYEVTLAGNRTLANPTNLVAGQSGVIAVTQDATGGRTLAFGGYWKFASGGVPSLTATAAAVDLIAYHVESATRISAVFHGDMK